MISLESNRQAFLGPQLEKVLNEKVIGVIGINGGNSHTVQQLANIGFKKFVLCDNQTIEQTNLTRNVLATLEDVNKEEHKVDIASRRIMELVSDAEIVKVRSKWQVGAEKGLFDNCDVIIAGVDTFSERDQIERFTRRLKKPLVDMGMDVMTAENGQSFVYGQVTMTFPGQVCLRCLGLLTDDRIKKEAAAYGDAGPKPQVVWPNGVLASTAISFLMDHLFSWTKSSPNYLYRQYDGNKFILSENDHVRELVKELNDKCNHYE